VGNEEKDLANGEEQGSGLGAEDTFLTGGVGLGATPRISASKLTGGADDGESYLFEDDSWRTGAEEEGEPGVAPAKPKGVGGRLKRFFGG
jgi:hypothetical protein